MKRIIASMAVVAVLALMPAAAMAEEPIKIGAFFALSGPAAHIGSATEAVAKMVVKKINDSGGVKGRKIELVTGDTEGEPTKAVMVLKKLFTRDKVVAVVGPSRSGSGMAVKKQAERAKTPIMMTVGADAVLWEGKKGNKNFGTAHYIFKTPQRSSTVVQVVLNYLKGKGLKNLAILTASDGFGVDGAVQLKDLIPKNKMNLVAEEQFNAKDVDMTPQLTKIAAKNPDAIICWTIGPAAAIISKNHNALGIKSLLVMNHGTPDPGYIKLAGAAAEGDIMPSTKLLIPVSMLPDSDPQKPVIKQFKDMYKAAGLEEKYPINTHSGYAWDAIYMIANAIEKVGTNRDKVRDAIEQTKNFVGISGVFNVTAADHNGLDTNSMVMIQVKDGKFVKAE